jgi:hypothetical protein
MAWNARSHGSPLHFVARVTSFHATHAQQAPLASRALGFVRALFDGAPDVALVALLGLAGDRAQRARWGRPLVAMSALLAFLLYGEALGGAPTHHPERALLAVWWVLAGFGIDGARALVMRWAWARPRREAWVVALGVLSCGAIGAFRAEALRSPPGASASEDRAEPIARGLLLREQGSPGFAVIPCAFEHFALIAAYGAPERVTIVQGERREECPTVLEGGP